MNRLTFYLKNKAFLLGFVTWVLFTLGYFFLVYLNFEVSPIAQDGLSSLLTMYLPVLLLTVFLLLYLTRNREEVNWIDHFAVNKKTAKKEAWMAVVYLLVTQLILGLGFNMGLHFPGTDIYTADSHSQIAVLRWVVTYSIIYTILPIVWLKKRGFSFTRLFSSLQWKRDIWIIFSYWSLDFFGPILSGSTDFIGGISARQYAQGIPWGIMINTLGAGLPVLVLMHLIFLPRVSVLVNNKFITILLGGLFYSLFSLFDQGVDYSNFGVALTSLAYIVMTQTLVGMGKATFTVVTGNPFIHFITLHVVSARVPFDTKMYIEIFRIK